MDDDSSVAHVADTAFWVAHLRAKESQRAAPAFHDPLVAWRSSQVIRSFEEAQRIGRPYPLDFPLGLLLRHLPEAMREKIHRLSGAVLMQNVARGVSKPCAMDLRARPLV